MRRGELEDEMRWSFASASPSRLSYRHTLALAITCIVGGAQSHERGIIACHVADVAIMDGIGGTIHPSIGTLAVFHDHGTHTLRRDVALGILMAFLQIEHRHCIVSTWHG